MHQPLTEAQDVPKDTLYTDSTSQKNLVHGSPTIDLEPVTNSDIIKKVIIILIFVSSFLIGLMVRMVTACLIHTNLQAGYSGNFSGTTMVMATSENSSILQGTIK